MWALTPQGCALARKIGALLGGQLFIPEKFWNNPGETVFSGFGSTVAARFHGFDGHVFIAATGLVVRTIAPLLRDKLQDPAVVVLDQNGQFAISLIGGHVAGANALAGRVAMFTGGQAVITTATDAAGLPALDVMARDLRLVPESPQGLKRIAASLLAGETVQIWDPESHLWPHLVSLGHAGLFHKVQGTEDWQCDKPGIWVSWKNGLGQPPELDRLFLRPRCLTAGLGFHRGVGADSLVRFIENVFQNAGLALASLQTLATITTRAGEPGLENAARRLGVNVQFFGPDQLKDVSTPHPSATVHRLVGTHSICEAAAILASRNPSLLVPKTTSRSMTLAVCVVR